MFFSQLLGLAVLSYSLGVGATKVNIAKGKETSQSSTLGNGISSRAVDGNSNPDYYKANSCTHTTTQTGPTWWCVNLKSIERFQTIKLYNRDKLKERLDGFSIKVSNTGGCDKSTFESSKVCYTDYSSSPKDRYTVNECKEGQFVFVTIPRIYLTLCEVEILQVVENIAFGKETDQSSTYVGAISSRAVDGNINPSYKANSCSHTTIQTGPTWWCVNLQLVERFNTIKLYNRDEVKERLKGFSIKVSNTGGCDQSTLNSSKVCYTDTSSSPQDSYTVNTCKEGQFVFVTVPHHYLTLCEVKIFQAVSVSNIAEGKETSQSSTLGNGISSRAVDGNINPRFYDAYTCTHTTTQTGPTWWCVNLQFVERFQTIRLYNRYQHKERLKGFSIKVSNTGGCDRGTLESSKVCYTDTSSTPQDSYTVNTCKEGQFVFVTVPHIYLTLCEVKILQTMWNIAQDKETSQSSTFRDGISSRAVDGNINPAYYKADSCTHTTTQTGPTWWCVNLKEVERFQTIKLYNRNINKGRLKGFSIKVSNTGGCDQSTFDSSKVCYTDTSSSPQDSYTVNTCKKGQFVFVTVPHIYLTLCEVKILQGSHCRPSCEVKKSTEGIFDRTIFPVNTEAECNAKCSATSGCNIGIFFYGECELFFYLAEKPNNSVNACRQLCNRTSGCRTFRHTGTTCFLYKKRFDKMVAKPHVSVLACKDVKPCI